MLAAEYTNAFLKDTKKMIRRGKPKSKLSDVLFMLINEEQLPAKYRNHKLTGNYRDHWECHIEPDWLLIYKVIGKTLVLVRTGTHSDLF